MPTENTHTHTHKHTHEEVAHRTSMEKTLATERFHVLTVKDKLDRKKE